MSPEHRHAFTHLRVVLVTVVVRPFGYYQDHGFLVHACHCGVKRAFKYGDYFDMVEQLDEMSHKKARA